MRRRCSTSPKVGMYRKPRSARTTQLPQSLTNGPLETGESAGVDPDNAVEDVVNGRAMHPGRPGDTGDCELVVVDECTQSSGDSNQLDDTGRGVGRDGAVGEVGDPVAGPAQFSRTSRHRPFVYHRDTPMSGFDNTSTGCDTVGYDLHTDRRGAAMQRQRTDEPRDTLGLLNTPASVEDGGVQ